MIEQRCDSLEDSAILQCRRDPQQCFLDQNVDLLGQRQHCELRQ